MLSPVKAILENSGYDYFSYSGCFDLMCRRKSGMYLVKMLTNIDSFQATQSVNIRTLSESLKTDAIVIGEKHRRGELEREIIYKRFGVPAMNPETFAAYLEKNASMKYSMRGGLFRQVEPELLKGRRNAKNLTQAELAKKVGISKKNIYEHEKRRMMARNDAVSRMEKLLGNVTSPFVMERKKAPPVPAKNGFENTVSDDMKRLGFSTKFVQQTPFNIIAEGSFTILLEAEENEKALQRKIPYIENFSRLSKKSAVLVTSKRVSTDLPVVQEQELKAARNAKDFRKLI